MPSLKLANENAIVMVDDDPLEGRIAARYLKKSRVRNQLVVLSSGGEFLHYLVDVGNGEKAMPALVMLDVRMPEMDGFQVLEEVRQQPEFRDLPIIMVYSNSDEEADVERALGMGADAYQVKPQSGAEYLEFLNSLA